MRNKLLIVLSFLLITCCTLFGFSMSSAETVVKTPGSVEITTGFTGGDSMMYYKTPVKGAVTVEFDIKFNQFQGAHFGFGLHANNQDSNPYASKLFFANSQAFYTPWAPSYIGNYATWENYNENYYGVYMYYAVRIKMEVNASGDVTLYAKSIENPAVYAGTNAQQTEYVQVYETLEGMYASEVASENGAYIAMFFRGGTDASMYYYGLKAVDTVGTYEEQMIGGLEDNYGLAAGVAGALSDGTLIYTEAVTEEVEAETDKEGALVFTPEYPIDGMMIGAMKLSGAMDIYLDIDMTSFANFGFGLHSNNTDSNPYASKLFFMGVDSVYTPWATAYLPAPTAYLNGYVFEGRTVIRMSIASDGSVTVYAGETKIIETVSGIYSSEALNGGYLAMFARAGLGDGYLYSIKIKDANGNMLNKIDFAYDALNTENFIFEQRVAACIGTALYWQQPTGEFIPAPTAELSVAGIATAVYAGNSVDLTPKTTNMAEGDEVIISVNGEEIEDNVYQFDEAGVYEVAYVVKSAEGEELDSAILVINVKAKSTQNNAEANFNQGYFDGREFEATAGVAVKDGALYFNAEEALFTTVGYSEYFILTYDVVSYVSGQLKVVFGCFEDSEYAFTFLENGKVEFDGEEYEVATNVYEVLAGGNKLTVRVKVFGGSATLYLRASNESVENIEIAQLTVSDIVTVGKVGFGGEAAEFTADNVKFVSLTTVTEDNTYNPTDEELNPGQGDEEPDEPQQPDQPDQPEKPKKGCKGGLGTASFLGMLALAGAAVLLKRKN